MTWQPPGRPAPAIIQVVVVGAPRGASLRLHAERLDDADERERVGERLRGALDRLEELLAAR